MPDSDGFETVQRKKVLDFAGWRIRGVDWDSQTMQYDELGAKLQENAQGMKLFLQEMKAANMMRDRILAMEEERRPRLEGATSVQAATVV